MSRRVKVGLVAVIVAVIGAIVDTPLMAADAPKATATTETGAVPKLVDLGAKSCIPCKKMAPILDALKKDYAGKFDVEFIDVGERGNAAKARQYGIRQIPTQVFLAKDGKEVFRHSGFWPQEELEKKLAEMGVK